MRSAKSIGSSLILKAQELGELMSEGRSGWMCKLKQKERKFSLSHLLGLCRPSMD
jgi:hypothetical protein